jgi:AAA-like domain/Leucine Rich repeats (2 copies)
MKQELHLQAGGTLNPRQHLYIKRRQDEIFLRLLLESQYVNVLTSRQMGKSSLMMRTLHRLDEEGVRWATIDLASELGSPRDLNAYYLGLLGKLVRSLRIELDLKTWWVESKTDTINQRLLRFFREVVGSAIDQPIVIFLDEIDSTLKLTYTDDLFTAIRGMYNERPIVESYRRLTFCLLGVATPNELVKDRRTTAYNVGTNLELQDFDRNVDNLTPLAKVLSSNSELGAHLLERVLHWTGGQPYLTVKICAEIVDTRISDVKAVDQFVIQNFTNLDRASADIHFQQILRFLEERLSDEAATLELYAKVVKRGRVPDQTTLAHAELKLSGLVKRDREGNLVVRNPIYERLFDSAWMESTRPRRALRKTRRIAIAASIALLISVGGGGSYYLLKVLPEQERLDKLERLAKLNIGITQVSEGGFRASFPDFVSETTLKEAIPLLKSIGLITEARVGGLAPISDISSLQIPIEKLSVRNKFLVDIDLGPFAELTDLRSFDGPASQEVTSLKPLKGLTNLTRLSLLCTDVTSLEPLAGLTKLEELRLIVPDVTSLEPLKGLTNLTLLALFGGTQATSLEPLKALTKLTFLNLSGATRVTSLEPLRGLTKLTYLNLSGATGVTSLEPLKALTQLSELDLSAATGVTSLEPLKALTQLSKLNLSRATGVTSLEPLRALTQLSELDLSGATGIKSLKPLKEKKIQIRGAPSDLLATMQ